MDLLYSQIQPQVIPLSVSPSEEEERFGGLISVDVDVDGQRDFIITAPGYIAAYDLSGQEIWTKQIDIQLTGQSESEGLPGLHAGGIQAADVDGDQTAEVLFLTRDNILHILQGATGEVKNKIEIESPDGVNHWEHLVIANFGGVGDQDLLLQATNAEGYRMGRYLSAYSLDELIGQGEPQPL